MHDVVCWTLDAPLLDVDDEDPDDDDPDDEDPDEDEDEDVPAVPSPPPVQCASAKLTATPTISGARRGRGSNESSAFVIEGPLQCSHADREEDPGAFGSSAAVAGVGRRTGRIARCELAPSIRASDLRALACECRAAKLVGAACRAVALGVVVEAALVLGGDR